MTDDITTFSMASDGSYPINFNSSNPNWLENEEYLRLFFKCQENFFTNTLNSRGYVFLNDIFDGLGVPRIPVGQLVGWICDSIPNPRTIKFNVIKNDDGSFTLDFNVDGIIYNLI